MDGPITTTPDERPLVAGRLTATLVGTSLTTVAWDGVELLRAVAYPVRDRDWGTLAPDVSDLRVEERPGGFTVTFTATAESGGATIVTEARIEAGDGRLTYAATTTPEADFVTNRTGFTVLHPVEASGLPLVVEHGDGSREVTRFPDLIEPWQPVFDIAALTHTVDGIEARVAFTGDVFEMEDQRAWGDASFKTYVRPLARPWPYVLPAGVPNRQVVALSVQGTAAHPPRPRVAPEVAVDRARTAPLPALALVLTAEEARTADLDRLREVAPDRLTAHLDAAAGHGAAELEAFAGLAAAFGGPVDLEYAARCDGDLTAEFGALAEALRAAGFVPASVLVSPSVDRRSTPPGSAWPACPPLQEVYDAARAALGDVPIGGGMLSYFTELNRKRPPTRSLAYVAFGTNPLVHAADDRHVMETLTALPYIMRSAAAIAGDRPLRLGLSSIPMRQNPYGSRTLPNPDGRRLAMADQDPRHHGDFGAAYALGYLAAVAPFRPEVWTPASLSGPRGVLAADGGLTPLGRLLAALAPLGGRMAHATTASAGIAALALEDRTLVANLGPHPRTVAVDGTDVALGAYDIATV